MNTKVNEYGVSEELQELVNSNKISLDEAKLLQAIRSNEIENPIKEENKVKPTKVKEVDEIVSQTKMLISVGENLIEKVSKAIDMLNNPNAMLFEHQELLNNEDTKQLSLLNENLKEHLILKVEQFKENLYSFSELKAQLQGYSESIISLYEESEEIGTKIIANEVEAIDEKERINQTQYQGQKL